MAKSKKGQYICRDCGAVHALWAGRCNECGSWNTLEEVAHTDLGGYGGKLAKKVSSKSTTEAPITVHTLSDNIPPAEFHAVGIAELDRVLGGGLVAGASILIGGDPGIGKSTLLLQAAHDFSENQKVLYISGEESIGQILLRSKRLGNQNATLKIAAETDMEKILLGIEKINPKLVIIDSIQTMFAAHIESAPGTVTQVRTTSHLLVSLAKKLGFAIILIGHVTKEGAIAGPRVLEHLVDTVLYFEGDRSQHFRLLRAVKNRFGACDEIGVFEMTSEGLRQVENPSALFFARRDEDIAGTCVIPALEGTRPILVEIQALVAPSFLATPRRAVIGWDSQRLAMILAVLEKRYGYYFSRQDVYLNITGGFRLQEPAADLAVVIALISSLGNHPVPTRLTAFGEIGLTGEIRAVPQAELRLKEAAKLGFTQAYIPKQTRINPDGDLQIAAYADLTVLVNQFPPPAEPPKAPDLLHV